MGTHLPFLRHVNLCGFVSFFFFLALLNTVPVMHCSVCCDLPELYLCAWRCICCQIIGTSICNKHMKGEAYV